MGKPEFISLEEEIDWVREELKKLSERAAQPSLNPMANAGILVQIIALQVELYHLLSNGDEQ